MHRNESNDEITLILNIVTVVEKISLSQMASV